MPLTLAQDHVWFHGTDNQFSEFNTKGIGSHFGTLRQALSAPGGRALILQVNLGVSNPMRLGDMYSWNPWDLLGILEDEHGVSNENLRLRIMVSRGCPDEDIGFQEEIKALIKNLGYDGIIYSNTMEGPGDSIIAFDPDQINILKTLPRASCLPPAVSAKE